MQIIGIYLAVGIAYVLFFATRAEPNFIDKMAKDDRGLGYNFALMLTAIALLAVAAIWPVLVIQHILKIMKK